LRPSRPFFATFAVQSFCLVHLSAGTIFLVFDLQDAPISFFDQRHQNFLFLFRCNGY
jgi:hypothetical protein